MEVIFMSEVIAWLRDEVYYSVHAIFVTYYMCTLEKVHLGVHYAD